MGLGLSQYIPLLLYLAAWAAALVSLKQPKFGVFVLVPILPFQNVLYKLHSFPLGKDLVDFLFLAILIGWLTNVRHDDGSVWAESRFTKYAVGLVVVSGMALVFGSLMWGLKLPFSLGDERFLAWKNFIMLPILFFLVLNVIRTRQEVVVLLALMVGGLFLADVHYYMLMRYKDLTAFHWDRKFAGILKTIGGNELAAFYTHFIFIPIGLFFYLKNWLYRIPLAGLAAFTTFPIMFLFSRGAYVGLFLGLLFVGVRRSRLLLLALIVVVVMWTSFLPPAIVERLEMTNAGYGELDNSASSRFALWGLCVRQFFKNPVIGVGFQTFRQFGGRDDPHNAYFEILAEQGAAGLLVMLGIFWFAFRNGLWLMKRARDPWFQALGLALAAGTVALVATNLFGDRWTYIQLNAWFWAMIALGVRSRHMVERELALEEIAARSPRVDRAHSPLPAATSAV